jgi:hypothetical protein
MLTFICVAFVPFPIVGRTALEYDCEDKISKTAFCASGIVLAGDDTDKEWK